MAIPGSTHCFLVVIPDTGEVATPATITASAEKATVAEIRPVELAPGTVGEVCVVADATEVETTGSVTIVATRDGASRP